MKEAAPEDDPATQLAYSERPSYPELALIVTAGAVHVITELAFSATASRIANVIIAVTFAGYLAWRIRTTTGVLRTWGFRGDNLRPALLAHLGFAAVAALVLFAIAAAISAIRIPATFWIAALFGLSHYPRLELLTLAFVAGIFFTLIYRRYPNLWAVGLAHGFTAALVFYLLLGEDPGANMLRAIDTAFRAGDMR